MGSPSKPFDWTPHALRRAAQRRINLPDAEAVYSSFHTERPGRRLGTRLLIGVVGDQSIKIIGDDRGEAITVITVADTESDDED